MQRGLFCEQPTGKAYRELLRQVAYQGILPFSEGVSVASSFVSPMRPVMPTMYYLVSYNKPLSWMLDKTQERET